MELEDFKGLLSDMFLLKNKIELLDKQKKEVTTELNKMKAVAMIALEENEMKTFKAAGLSVTKVDKKSVKILDKNLFLNWLETKGDLRDYLSVSSVQANKIYNAEFEIAQENQDIEFLTNGIDGLSEPETHSLIMMKGKL